MTMRKLSILSNPKYLANVRKETEQICERAGLSKHETSKVVLAVGEACANIIRHSYNNNYRRRINIKMDIKNKSARVKQIEIILRDYGIKPSPKKITGKRPKIIRPGGLGVYFIKKIMDEVIYDTTKTKGTELTLIKLCK